MASKTELTEKYKEKERTTTWNYRKVNYGPKTTNTIDFLVILIIPFVLGTSARRFDTVLHNADSTSR